MVGWKKAAYAIDAVLAVLIALGLWASVKKYMKSKKA